MSLRARPRKRHDSGQSRRANPWAAKLYNDAIARGHDHPHAVRILARAWLSIIWRCWQNSVAYEPAKHRALQALLAEHGPFRLAYLEALIRMADWRASAAEQRRAITRRRRKRAPRAACAAVQRLPALSV